MEVEDTPVHWNTEPSNKKRTKDGKKFTDEQVKLLESMFKEKTKLEPRKKLELARDLGLQPRQVAIWFQNRRARWKSKQIEHEYRVLKEEFDNLNMQFETLKKEKESLLKQVKELNDQLENNHSGSNRSQDSIESEIYTSSYNGGTELERKDNIQDCFIACLDQERITEVNNDGTIEQFMWKEEAEFWDVEELGDSSLASPQHWCAVDQDGALDLSCGNSKLWEF